MPTIFGFPTESEVRQQRFANMVQLLSQAPPGVGPGVAAGQGLGRFVGGVLGLQDTEAARAQALQEVQQEVTQLGLAPGRKGFIDAVANRLRAKGFVNEAFQIQQEGSKLEKQALEIENLRERTTKLQLENLLTAQEQNTLKALPDKAQLRIKLRDKMTAEEKEVSNIAAGELEGAQLGNEEYARRFLSRTAELMALAQTTPGQTVTQTVDFETGRTVSTRSPRLPIGRVPAAVPTAPVAPRQGQVAPRPAPPTPGPAQPGRPIQPGEDVTVDSATKRARGGKVRIRGERPRAQSKTDQEVITAQAKEAAQMIPAIQKLMRGSNRIAKIIEEDGQSFPSLFARYADTLRRVGGDSFVADLGRTVASAMEIFDFQDPRERAVVAKLNQALVDMQLSEKDRQNLGVIAGPDMFLLNSLIPRPTGPLARLSGMSAYFTLANQYYQGLLDSAQDATNRRGGTIDFPAPHPMIMVAGHDNELRDLARAMQENQMNPRDAAREASRRLGVAVSGAAMMMMAGTGAFAPLGSAGGQALEAFGNIGGEAVEALDLPSEQDILDRATSPEVRFRVREAQEEEDALNLLRRKLRDLDLIR